MPNRYRIYVTFEGTGYYDVVANSQEEAEEKYHDGEYENYEETDQYNEEISETEEIDTDVAEPVTNWPHEEEGITSVPGVIRDF